jgi:hypothetical protein
VIATNPVLPFNKTSSPQDVQAMQILTMLLGGLAGRPASMPLSPSNALGAPEPQYNQLQTILGGLSAGLPR